MDEATVQVLHEYPKAVLALRSAFRDRRLGLMLGAGVSRAFDFSGKKPPDWRQLVAAIERDISFDATPGAYAALSVTQRVDVLFRFFLNPDPPKRTS
jgi:hypothetical protein